MTVQECFRYVREEFMPDVNAEEAEKMKDEDLAKLIRSRVIAFAVNNLYQAAQDAMAETEIHLDTDKMIQEVVTVASTIKQHLDEGRELGLQDEEIFIHDEIYGFLMDRFEETVIPTAKDFCHYLHHRMETPRDFLDHLREVRDRDFAEGWLTDMSLAMMYLMARAEWMANDEED